MKTKPQPIKAELQMLTSHTGKTDHLTAAGLKAQDLLECNERYIVFHWATTIFPVETLVSFKLKLQFKGGQQSFSATGKVSAVKKDTEGLGVIYQVQLRQFDRSVWRQFLQAAEGEGLRVDNIFQAIKGDAV